GVVLITTKQGSKGKGRVDASVYTGFQQIVKKLDMLNGEQLIDLLNEEKANAGEPPVSIPPDLEGVNNNWQDIVYHKAPMTGANVGFSTGGENGTYYLGLGYLNQEGIVHLSNFIRYSINMNIEQNINKWLTAGAHVNYNRANSRDVPDNARVNQGGVVLTALSTPPFVKKYNDDGTFGLNPFQAWENPLASIEGPYNKTVSNNLLGDAHIQIKLPFYLQFRSQFGISLFNSNYDYFLDPYRTQYGRSKQGIGQNNTSEIFRYIWDNTLTYNRTIEKHALNVVLGSSASEQKETFGYQYGEGFPNAAVQTLNAATTNKQISTTKQEWSLESFFGRINYSYNDRYLLTASFRADASSRFGTDNQWAYFPAFSGGWRISKEDFMKNVTLINDLKLRAGWGVTGNLPPVYYPSYSKLSTGYNYSFGGVIVPGVIPDQEIGNPDLVWEKTNQFNGGFDITIFSNKITLSADYYIKKTTDLIFQENVPMSTGLGYRYSNAEGYVQNSGFEFNVTGNIFSQREFIWTSSLNMSFNKNVVKNLDSGRIIYAGAIPERDYVTVVKEGLPLGAFWGFISDGVDPATGNIKFRDLNGDGVVDADHDRTYLGSALPKFTFGFTNDFSYKNFSLNVLIDGVVGNKVFNATRIETEGMFQVNNSTTAALRRWKKSGDITDIPKAVFADPDQNSRVSSRFIESGSFLRFRQITLSYNFNNNWTKSIGLSTVRLYATMQNWFTISDYKGYQPEVNRDGTNAISQGIDYGTYPQAKVLTFGINISL
ncbi:MAG TPA: SusC/RagA family TonB-linked outer membrane protein, partial [Chitinophagaceae bacterium]